MPIGKILAGVLAPHPPHLVYADKTPRNEAQGECGWENLRWGYEKCRANILAMKPDVFLIHTPHWQTQVGHHVLGLPHFSGISVDPIFPHIFRYNYDFNVDVDLSLNIADEAKKKGLISKVMRNPDFRVDYGAITSLHLMNPDWNIPVVVLSANNSPYCSFDKVELGEMNLLGEATYEAIKKSGKRVVLLASVTLSHRHFVKEPEIVEDMSKEHTYSHAQYIWDMRVLKLMKEGRCKELLDIFPQFIEETMSEVQAGSLNWMLHAMGIPNYPAEIHGYGTVIGTGNAVVEWKHEQAMGANA